MLGFKLDEEQGGAVSTTALPAAVEEARAAILDAAESGDYEKLSPLVPETGFEYTFGGPVEGGAIAYWQELERTTDERPLEALAAILEMPYVLSHGYYDAYYLQAQKVRRLIAGDFAAAFASCELILGPTSPSTAFALGAKTEDPVQMYLNDIFTIPAPLAGLPGLSIPCGFDAQGLPVGLQVMGNYFSEARMLGAAHRYQQASDWHTRVPKETPL